MQLVERVLAGCKAGVRVMRVVDESVCVRVAEEVEVADSEVVLVNVVVTDDVVFVVEVRDRLVELNVRVVVSEVVRVRLWLEVVAVRL